MGSGKSYTGRNLALLLKYDYIDSDIFISEKENKSINEIFDTEGEEYFRKLEHNFLLNLDKNKNTVISTGGGMPCFYDNMDLMNEKGMTIYLNRPKEKVMMRLLRGQYKRPLLKGLSPEKVANLYDEKLEFRKPFYEQAKLSVDDAEVEEIYQLILSSN